VNQRGGLKGLTGRFIRHPMRRQFAQLLIDEREQFVSGVGLALLDRGQDLSYVAHTPDAAKLCSAAPDK